MSSGRAKARREFLGKAGMLAGAGIAGAALMGGADRTVLAAPPPGAAAYMNQWNQIMPASIMVWVDSGGSYYAKDNGIGSEIGEKIVDANVITAYGASLGAGTAGVSTTTAAIQEAVNCLRGTGGLVQLAAGIYNVTTTITSYPGICIRGLGLLSAFANIGTCAIQVTSMNVPVIKLVVDPSNTSNVVFPRLEGFAINGTGATATSQDGILISKTASGDILDAYIKDVGVFAVGGNGLNIQDNVGGNGNGKYWVEDFYTEGCKQNGILQVGGWLRIQGGYETGNTLNAVNASNSQYLEILEHRFESSVSSALVVAGPMSFGLSLQACHFNSNGGVATPQVSISAITTKQSFKIIGCRFDDGRGGGVQVNNHIVIGSSSGGSILGNDFNGSTNIAVDPGQFNIIYIRDNYGLNPINKVTNPFNTNNLTYLHGTTAVPVASTDYPLYSCDALVTAADSANSDNAILVKDNAGNTVFGPVHTLSGQFVPIGYKINWGAFTGVAGAVTFCGI